VSGGSKKLKQLFGRENEGERPAEFVVREHASGNDFMRWILGARMIGETANHSEATFPLGRRWRLGGPIDGSLSSYVDLRAVRGKAGKVAEQTFVDLQVKPGRASYFEVSADGLFQHGDPPSTGQRCATERSSGRSTLA
jgi:hypothetical protein